MTPDALLPQLKDAHPLIWAVAYWLLELERHPSRVRFDAAKQAIDALTNPATTEAVSQ